MFTKLLKDLRNGKITLEDIFEYQYEFDYFLTNCVEIINSDDCNLDEVKSYLELCLDMYTHNEDGRVLISDSDYDMIVSMYESKSGTKMTIYSSEINKKKWDYIDHKVPGMVGSLDKIYSEEELESYMYDSVNKSEFMLAPKYDGVSCCLEVKDGQLISAATRYNGIKGQNITELVRNASNISTFLDPSIPHSFIKCELVISNNHFEDLNDVARHKGTRVFSNRRSATSGIVNTPSNLHYAEFVTIIPLVRYLVELDKFEYIAPLSKEVFARNSSDLYQIISDFIYDELKTDDFPIRVDGVVIIPINFDNGTIDRFDVMSNCIAFKINTSHTLSKVLYAYMSVGRTGRAIPMIKVQECEVNETMVNDVSLSSYGKFKDFGILEDEVVIVSSAGDVIPQITLQDVRPNFGNSNKLELPMHCPYCSQPFTKVGNELYCTNNVDCIRVITGRIAAFIDKLGVQNFSDKTTEMIYTYLGIRDIPAFLELTVEQLVTIPGVEVTMATKLVEEINILRAKPIGVSTFMGALGVDGISTKKCRKIFDQYPIDEFLSMNPNPVEVKVMEAKMGSVSGIGPRTSNIFMTFILNNRLLIEELFEMMNIVNDVNYGGTVIFTGFRDKALAAEIDELGFEVPDSGGVTRNTVMVIGSSVSEVAMAKSKKLQAALKYEIPIYGYSNASAALDYLKSLS